MRHVSAVVGTFAAFVRTHLTMLILEPVAFCSTGIADGCAESAELRLKFAVPRHELGGERADIGTVSQQRHTPAAGLNIGLFKAGFKALFADLHAAIARIDAFLVFDGCFNDGQYETPP